MRYRVEIKRSAGKEIEAISNKKLRSQIVAWIAKLADDPRPAGCQRLSGREAYRIRPGAFRIVYTIEDDVLVVVVVRVAHRRDVYR